MIEENVIQSPMFQSQQGTFSELKTGLRPVHISRLNYDYENHARASKGSQTERLYSLSPRAKNRTSRGLENRLQEGFTISYNQGLCGLLQNSARRSIKDSSKGQYLYAKNTERNSAQYQSYSTRDQRAKPKAIRRAKRNNKSAVEGIKSEAIRCYVSGSKRLNCLSINVVSLGQFSKGFIVLLNQKNNALLSIILRALKIEIIGIKLLSSSALLNRNNPIISGSISALNLCYFNRLNSLLIATNTHIINS